MYSPRKKLSTPKEYAFPYLPPYDIQQKLMEELYAVLESKRIGIFESPTGTGKSLTLTCGALRWLEDHEQLVRADLTERLAEVQQEIMKLTAKANSTDDWITAQYAAQQQREELFELQALGKSLAEHEQRLKDLRERQVKQRKERILAFERKKEAQDSSMQESSIDGDSAEGQWEEEDHALSADDKILDDEFGSSNGSEERYRDVKIFFCSRTHTQLSQVVREVKRTAYGKRIRCISLASRQQLCINPTVKRLPNVSLINERCLDMSRSTNTGDKKKSQTLCHCAFRAATAVQLLSDTISTDIHDIEDLVAEGETTRACPYYAARAAVATAQLIMLPYQMLLHRRTRAQSGIDLRGAVVIIDEAHNLLDTIAQMHSCELTLQQLQAAQQQITAYKIRYAKRFSSTNLLRINQLLFVTKRLAKLLLIPADNKASRKRMFRTYELTAEGEFFNIDLFQLLEFCERMRFAQKLQGFIAHQTQELCPSENNPPPLATAAATGLLQRMQQQYVQQQCKQHRRKSASVSADQLHEEPTKPSSLPTAAVSSIRPLLAFMEALTENAEDGRVLVSVVGETAEITRSSFKYILLNPSGHFEDVVRDARAIIIAGGTMQPTAELTEQLFHYCAERVELHFYDHVVPAEAVLPSVVTKGPISGSAMCFNYANRGSNEMLTELGMFLQNICNVIPAGVVCFLPSYDYLDLAYGHLKRIGVCERIAMKKRIFCETRSSSGTSGQSVEKLLADYAAAIDSTDGSGALLFSVVGGKLSEGLNFADDLGRAVIVVGMPYPNRHSLELKQRMAYLDRTLDVGAGNEYYENLCMKAVNQCIGRSVRHIHDYACVFLVDERYASERIQKKLPQWILRSLRIPSTFGVMQAATARFFKERRLLSVAATMNERK